MVTLTASSQDQAGLRRIRRDVKTHHRALTGDADLAEHLSSVVWELLTNLADHPDDKSAVTVEVVVDLHRVVVRLPGEFYDSVDRAEQPMARGLDSAKYRLTEAKWNWSHRHVDGANVIWLEREQ